MCLYAAYYLGFLLLDPRPLMLIAPLVFGIGLILFWLPYNYVMASPATGDDRGTRIGAFFFAWTFVATIAPFLGGSLISGMGYAPAFGAAAVCLIGNMLFIALADRKGYLLPRKSVRATGAILGADTTDHIGPRLGAMIMASGATDSVLFIGVPLALLTFTSSEMDIGLILSLLSLAGSITMIVLARVSDRMKRRAPILAAFSVMAGLASVAAALSGSATAFVVSMSLVYFFLQVIPVFLMAMAIDRCCTNVAGAIVSREVYLNVGRVGGGIIGALLLLLFDSPFHLFVLVAAAFGVIGIMGPGTRE
jgi:predicted MFS family arabinose efflux permease